MGRYQQNLTVADSDLNDAAVELKEEEKQKWRIHAVTYARTVTKRGHHKMTKAKTKYMYSLVEAMPLVSKQSRTQPIPTSGSIGRTLPRSRHLPSTHGTTPSTCDDGVLVLGREKAAIFFLISSDIARRPSSTSLVTPMTSRL